MPHERATVHVRTWRKGKEREDNGISRAQGLKLQAATWLQGMGKYTWPSKATPSPCTLDTHTGGGLDMLCVVLTRFQVVAQKRQQEAWVVQL